MKKILYFFCILPLLIACNDGIDYVKDFTDGKLNDYAGTADSLKYYAGNYRVGLGFNLGSDPNLNKTVIYWNLRKDSLQYDFDRDTITNGKLFFVIENLSEGVHTFEVINYNSRGVKSIKQSVTARVYGKSFRNSIYDRSVDISKGVRGFYMNAETEKDAVFMVLTDTLYTSKVTEVEYIGTDDQKYFVEVTNKTDTIALLNLKPESELTLKTIHRPEPNAMDTFARPIQKVIVPNATELNETDLTIIPKPYASAYIEGFDSPVATHTIWYNLWDGRWGKTYPVDGNDWRWAEEAGWADHGTQGSSEPTWITFDMTRYGILQNFWFQSYSAFSGSCPKKYEIWAFTGDGKPTAADAWGEKWVKIREEEYSYVANNVSLQTELFAIGYNNYFKYEEVPYARYYRIKNLENWNGAGGFSLGEISFTIYSNDGRD